MYYRWPAPQRYQFKIRPSIACTHSSTLTTSGIPLYTIDAHHKLCQGCGECIWRLGTKVFPVDGHNSSTSHVSWCFLGIWPRITAARGIVHINGQSAIIVNYLAMIGSVSVKELCQAKDTPTEDPTCVRPPISFASPSALFRSVYARFLSLWTPSFIRSILYGQVLSLTLTVVSVLTTELVHRNWVLPSTQVIFP